MLVTLDIHKAKEIVLLLNSQAQVILGMEIPQESKKQLLNYIDDVKRILEESVKLEEK